MLQFLSSLLLVTAVACGGGEPPAGRVNADDSAAQSQAAALVSRVKSLAGNTQSVDEVAERAGSYVTSLPNSDKLLLGRALIAEARSPFAVYGASILVAAGEEQAAGPVFARFVLDGGDMTGFFYSWMHGADARTALRMYITIAEILLPQFSTLAPAEKARAQEFLATDSIGPPIPAFSEQAVRDRIESLKRELLRPPPPR